MIQTATDRLTRALEAHAEYRAKGYEPIPVKITRKEDDRGVPKKRPYFPGNSWEAARDLASDPDRLRKAVEEGYQDVALVCGNIAALDFDQRDGESIEDTRARAREAVVAFGLQSAVCEETARGIHVLTRAPKANGTPWAKRTFKPPHLVDEVQVGDGALIFVAPSWHPVAGQYYRRVTDLVPVNELPECSLDLLVAEEPEREPYDAGTAAPFTGTRGRGDWSTLDVVGLFKEAGLYGKDLGGGKHGVRCPWAHEHTTGSDGTDTTVWEASNGKGPGFKCLHAHCDRRGIRDVRDYFGTGAVDRWCVDEFQPRPRYVEPDGAADNSTNGSTAANADGPAVVTVDDFEAYLPDHRYIHRKTRLLWSSAGVDGAIKPIKVGKDKWIKASRWLDQNRKIIQMTWAPGEPEIIRGRIIQHGGWLEDPTARVFNRYRAPRIEGGDPERAGLWVKHVHHVYPTDADHLIRWMAQRVQRPQEKVNHAIVLGGAQGIGKDTMLEPLKYAVGPWNFHEIVPGMLLQRFNGWIESVVLRISEGHDLGDLDRYSFYERLKLYTAAPPDVIRCDTKYTPEYAVPNVCGVILTTNHKTSGIYLPADDRRHYVAWSDRTRDEFSQDYWTKLWTWYERGGFAHVAAYLRELDLSGFNAKAPPPKTQAFWDIVDANRAPEDAELADVLDKLMTPDAVTVNMIIAAAGPGSFRDWLEDRRNRRQIPHRLEEAGYVRVGNPTAKSGLWVVGGKRQAVYGRRDVSERARIAAATQLMEAAR